MTEELVLSFPQQLVLPVPDFGSFAITYVGFGLLFMAVSRFMWPFEDRLDSSRTMMAVTWIMMAIAWPALMMLILYDMEKKLREENLYEEFLEELG